MCKDKDTHSKSRGQSLVEFAFGLVMLLFLVVGIVDGTRALFTYMSLRDAAQEGALYGSTAPFIDSGGSPVLNPEIETRTRQSSSLVESLASDVDVLVELIDKATGNTFTVATRTPCLGDGIRVRVSYDNFPLTMPLIGELIGAGGDYTVPISAWVTDTILVPPCD
jgi:Flp pilus assembly protein TadG